MPFRMGPWEIGLILLVVLIIFGVGKLPQVGGAIGRGIREFRKTQRGDFDEGEKEPESKDIRNSACDGSDTKERHAKHR